MLKLILERWWPRPGEVYGKAKEYGLSELMGAREYLYFGQHLRFAVVWILVHLGCEYSQKPAGDL